MASGLIKEELEAPPLWLNNVSEAYMRNYIRQLGLFMRDSPECKLNDSIKILGEIRLWKNALLQKMFMDSL